MHNALYLLLVLCLLTGCGPTSEPGLLELAEEDRNIVLIGGNLGSRLHHFDYLEPRLQARFPDRALTVSNLCDPGNTAGFRPHSSREDAWAFPGAADYHQTQETGHFSDSEGQFPSEDAWLDSLNADVILAFFGYSESFGGKAGLTNFALELDSFLRYTQVQSYSGRGAPRVVLISPPAFEDLSATHPYPDGSAINPNLELYTRAMGDIAADNGVPFVDLFTASQSWYADHDDYLTTDGHQLNDAGYRLLAEYLTDEIFGAYSGYDGEQLAELKELTDEKNYYWHYLFKMPNGVHVHGRRFEPYGVDNYPYEIRKTKELIANRDAAIQAFKRGEDYDLAAADAASTTLPPVETNYTSPDGGPPPAYRYGVDALASFTVADGFRIDLFASEQDFPELANPCQLAFDDRGRLWVSTMPSYPHYKPGDARPDDKLLILEDTDNDGRADRATVFKDGLHLPVGFAFGSGGVYVSQGTNLMFYRDTDGDDRADYEEIVLSGFDDHDTHHNSSAFVADPSGAIYTSEGIFLHTNVETAYGPVRATGGGFYRFDPRTRKLERVAQLPIPNPWGTAFDAWGQPFFLETSSPPIHWMSPSTVRPYYGVTSPLSPDMTRDPQRVRPTCGMEFISSQHFPPEQQGDMLVGNDIGFLGIKQFAVRETGTGYVLDFRQDLLESNDPNFRPVDHEFGPDGALYVVDWHNQLIGHMQHNARDPLRDHSHGRVYRVTHRERPLVEPLRVDGASVMELLNNLKSPDYRVRYRSRRVLREKEWTAVDNALGNWLADLDADDPNRERYLLEALYVMWGAGRIDPDLHERLLTSDDHRVRAIAVRAARYVSPPPANYAALLLRAAGDPHGRVRVEAITAASWADPATGQPVMDRARELPADPEVDNILPTAESHLNGKPLVEETIAISSTLAGEERVLFAEGKAIYEREGHCATCHQPDGKGLIAAGYPPLTGTTWTQGDPERLIKLTMHGLYGPMEVLGKTYDGTVPMTAFGGLLDDREMAAVLTYVRNSFGNVASSVTEAEVAAVRAATAGRKGTYSPAELLRE